MKHLLAILVVATVGGTAVADPAYKCHAVDAATKLRADFAQPVSLADLAAWVVGFSCKNVVFTPEVAKHATRVHIAAPNEMTPKQAIQLFLDAVDATGLVATDKGDTIVIKLGANMPSTCPDTTASNPPANNQPATAPPAADELTDAELDAGIKATDATHVTITTKLLDKIFANPTAIAGGARVVPAVANGKPIGFKLYAIRPSSVFARLGLQNGDTLTQINGFDLTSADKALEAYTKLREATTLQVDVQRGGKAVSIYVTVK